MKTSRRAASETTEDLEPRSPRLTYRRLRTQELGEFHSLVIDDHIRRFLLDGQEMPRDWSAGVVRTSDEVFASRGVGLWLVYKTRGTVPIGFGGYRIFEELGPEPQLLYALREAYTGLGYATEIALALVEFARRGADFGSITAAVDAPNGASVRVLEKAGFRRSGEAPGGFGATYLFRLPAPPD